MSDKPDRCACGASYEAFRSGLTFATAREMLRVGSDDPDLWVNRSRPAVLRFMAEHKRNLWDSMHGYCAAAIDELIEKRGCDCDHCNPERWQGALAS